VILVSELLARVPRCLFACSKDVSSHIQVLARRKSREFQSKLKVRDRTETFPEKSSAAQETHSRLPRCIIIKPFSQQAYSVQTAGTTTISGYEPPSAAQTHREPAWQGRSIGTTKLRLVEFSSFLETQRDQEAYNKHLFVHISQSSLSYSDPLLECVDIRQIYDKFPEKKGGLKELFDKGPQNAFYLIKFWADLNYNVQDDPAAFYGVTSQYESSENMTITCSTKVCSFGKQVVEKVETEYARFENGRFVYRISRSPMCEYMINFIHKLKHLPEKYMMNSVLENFTILLVVSNRDTQETLLCMACVFEVSNNEHGAQHHIYRLIKE
uniref:TEA domain family member 1a n=1 Tax=Neolamprologus brichardi TaxID=32507 RepID=A0A3Q4G0W8_NEOBR